MAISPDGYMQSGRCVLRLYMYYFYRIVSHYILLVFVITLMVLAVAGGVIIMTYCTVLQCQRVMNCTFRRNRVFPANPADDDNTPGTYVWTAAVRLTNMKLYKSFTPVSRVISIVFNFDQIMERLTLMKRTNKNFSVCLAKFASTMMNNLVEHC